MTGWEHRDELLRYVRRLLGAHAEAAEDVVQEAYLRLHERQAAGSPVREARPWLFRVSRNLALDERRRLRRGDAALTALGMVAAPPHGPLDVLQGREEARAALEGIDALPPRERRTVLLDQAGLAPPAIARRIGTTTNAVHQSLFRARRRMRDARAAGWALLPLPLARLALRAAGSPALEGLPVLGPGSGGRIAGGAGAVSLVVATLVGGGVVAERGVVPHRPHPAPARDAAAPTASRAAPAAAPATVADPAARDAVAASAIAAADPVVPDRSAQPRRRARVAPAGPRAERGPRRDDVGDGRPRDEPVAAAGTSRIAPSRHDRDGGSRHDGRRGGRHDGAGAPSRYTAPDGGADHDAGGTSGAVHDGDSADGGRGTTSGEPPEAPVTDDAPPSDGALAGAGTTTAADPPDPAPGASATGGS